MEDSVVHPKENAETVALALHHIRSVFCFQLRFVLIYNQERNSLIQGK
jgi:hypothetical protein